MQPFLASLAEHVLKNYSDSLSEICIVTPNRRSGLFFRKYLGKMAKGPVWAPEIISFEDFLYRITGLKPCDHITLCIEFYKTYKEIKAEEAESFEDFLKWASTLLKDFNDLDSATVNTKEFFAYLNDVKNLEAWDPEGQGLTDFQKDYLAFFLSMEAYYTKLTEKLLKNNNAYQGLAIRHAIDNFDRISEGFSWKKIVFAGFNAMPAGEELLIKKLVKGGFAEILWDADNYYFDNPNHEAGLFLRRYKENWKLNKFDYIEEFFKNGNKNIQIIGIPKNVNQTKLAGNILGKFDNIGDETAVVLANENLLLPLLNSLPENIDALNVTMGFPLKKTGMYSFFESVFRMHINAEKFGLDGEMPRFYHKDMLRLFTHSALLILADNHMESDFKAATNSMIESNRILHSQKTISEINDGDKLLNSLPISIFSLMQNPAIAVKSLIDICGRIEANLSDKTNTDESETPVSKSLDIIDEHAVTQIKTVLRRLEVFVEETGFIPDLRTLFSLFQALVSESKLSFTGEPLKGLQVIGMLETRNLDFKNIVLLSANEDILPAPSKKVSFISYDIKQKYVMQVYSDSDALYAYHFYRLLQRAENVYLIYNASTAEVGSSEKSRYITQIEHELSDYNQNISVNHEIISIPVPTSPESYSISIDKTDEIISRLFVLNENGFSPSALSIYIKCPLQFYFSYVANIKEAEEVEETIEANTLGNVVHEVLKELYGKFVGKVLSTDDIQSMIPRIESVTTQKFKKIYKGGVTSGKNLLIKRMAEKLSENFLRQEINVLKSAKNQLLTVLSLEEKYTSRLNVNQNGSNYSFNFKGTIDRVDNFGGDLRVIDYKTGMVDKKELKVEDLSLVFTEPDLNKSFQLLTYSYLFNKNNTGADKITAGIFSLRKFTAGLFTLQLTDSNFVNEDIINEFESGLKSLMLNVFDKNTPFTQTEDVDNCRYCPYINICNR